VSSSPVCSCLSCPAHPNGSPIRSSRLVACGFYPSSSMTDAQWALIEPLLPPAGNTGGRGGRPEAHPRRRACSTPSPTAQHPEHTTASTSSHPDNRPPAPRIPLLRVGDHAPGVQPHVPARPARQLRGLRPHPTPLKDQGKRTRGGDLLPPHHEGSQTGHQGARRESVPCALAPDPAGTSPGREEITT
jgi:hypothetical protein